MKAVELADKYLARKQDPDVVRRRAQAVERLQEQARAVASTPKEPPK